MAERLENLHRKSYTKTPDHIIGSIMDRLSRWANWPERQPKQFFFVMAGMLALNLAMGIALNWDIEHSKNFVAAPFVVIGAWFGLCLGYSL